MSLSKKQKATAARKNAEALKAQRKAQRTAKSVGGFAAPKGKSKSIVGQSKAKKRK
ncbi:MAG: hypothetical protein AB8F74_17280 [Saprospiraceae bacterium]